MVGEYKESRNPRGVPVFAVGREGGQPAAWQVSACREHPAPAMADDGSVVSAPGPAASAAAAGMTEQEYIAMTQEPPPPESPPPYVDVQALLDLPIPAPIPAPRVPSDPRDELWDPHHLAADGDDEDDEEQADAVNPLATSSAEETLARISAPPVPSGRKASKFYSEANMLKRLELMKHPEILASLEKLWVSVRDLRPRNLVASGRCSKALLEGPSACAASAHPSARSPRDPLTSRPSLTLLSGQHRHTRRRHRQG